MAFFIATSTFSPPGCRFFASEAAAAFDDSFLACYDIYMRGCHAFAFDAYARFAPRHYLPRVAFRFLIFARFHSFLLFFHYRAMPRCFPELLFILHF